MSTLEHWTTDAAQALGLPADSIDNDLRDRLLDLTRDVAHGVARIAGPLTTYLVGLAVGGGMVPAAAISRLAELAATRTGDGEDGGDGGRDGASNRGDGAHREGVHGDRVRNGAHGDGATRERPGPA